MIGSAVEGKSGESEPEQQSNLPQETAPAPPPVPLEAQLTEVQGLILNATFSGGGYDFYLAFTHQWAAPPGILGYNIVIREVTSRGRNVTLAIDVNGQNLVYRTMQPSIGALQALAAQAAEYINSYLYNQNHLRVSGGDPDLSGEGYY